MSRSVARAAAVAALLAAGAVMLVAPCALAANVTIRATREGTGELVFVAAPGEENDVFVALPPLASGTATTATVTDTGAVLTAAPPCAPADRHTAICTWPDPGLSGLRVVLGDRDDELVAGGAGARVFIRADGGPGDDRLREIRGSHAYPTLFGGDGDDRLTGHAGSLHGGPGDDVLRGGRHLRGGPGDDRLVGDRFGDILLGGGGNDALHGGRGDDWLRDGDAASPGPDVLDGGPGMDNVSYRQRTRPVRADLGAAKPVSGERGEGDTLIALEEISGGHAGDRLVGSDGPDRLYGREGHDRLAGRGGSDKFWPGTGSGTIRCGAGRDVTYAGRHAGDDLEPDCERLHPTWQDHAKLPAILHGPPDVPSWTIKAYPTTLPGPTLSYRFGCPDLGYHQLDEDDYPIAWRSYPITRCPVTIQIRATGHRHQRLASASVRSAGRSSHILLAVTPAGQRLARRAHGVRAIVSVAVTGVYHPRRVHFTTGFRWTIRLVSRG